MNSNLISRTGDYHVYEHGKQVFIETPTNKVDFHPEYYWGSFETLAEANAEANMIRENRDLQWHEDGTGNWVIG